MISPTSQPLPRERQPLSLSVLVNDDRAIAHLIENLMARANLTPTQLADLLGVRPQTIFQYKHGMRRRPSIQWMLRLIDACGGKLILELPASRS